MASDADAQVAESFAISHRPPSTATRPCWVHRLPVELLCAIFAEARDTLWTLSYVCGYWRTAVLSSPRLWAHVNITDSILSMCGGWELLELQLMRSGGCVPIAVSLSLTQHVAFVLDLLLPHFHRCKELHLQSLPRTMTARLAESKLRYASLEVLHISTKCQGLATVPLSAPILRVLAGATDCVVSDLQLCWRDITTYNISSPQTAADHLQVLCQMPNLRVCTLALTNWSWKPLEHAHALKRVELPKLEELEMRNVSRESEGAELLSRLVLPRLASLSLHGQPWGSDVVHSVLEQSRCRVQFMGLHSPNAPKTVYDSEKVDGGSP